MGFNYKSATDSLSINSSLQSKSVFDNAMGHINKSHINATSPTDIYGDKKNNGHSINPAVRTHMQQDIMRNGITKGNRAVARMIDGNSGVYNTMVNQGLGDVADRQIEYQETSAQFGTATFTHMFNDSAIKNTSDRGNGLMMDELTVDSQNKTIGSTENTLPSFGKNNNQLATKAKISTPVNNTSLRQSQNKKSFSSKNKDADIHPPEPSERKRNLKLETNNQQKQKIIKKFSKLNQKQKKEVMRKIIEKLKNAKSIEEKEHYNKMLKIIK